MNSPSVSLFKRESYIVCWLLCAFTGGTLTKTATLPTVKKNKTIKSSESEEAWDKSLKSSYLKKAILVTNISYDHSIVLFIRFFDKNKWLVPDYRDETVRFLSLLLSKNGLGLAVDRCLLNQGNNNGHAPPLANTFVNNDLKQALSQRVTMRKRKQLGCEYTPMTHVMSELNSEMCSAE